MSTESSTSKAAAGRAPDNRFKRSAAARDRSSVIRKIEVTSLQLDDSFDGDGDPYNNTGRHLVKAIREK